VVAAVEDPYRLNSEGEVLRNGTFVKANIEGREIPDLVPVPRHILRTGNQLWVVDENERLRNRDIKALRTEGKMVYVYEGLENGDRICLSSVPNAISGTLVKVNTEVSTRELLDGSRPDGLSALAEESEAR
jgi:multidrug efflux pump subunit AcrA (membrane-fusion protein)